MEKLYVFGTGNAAVTRCYNTCFAVRDDDSFFMVDAGGGNGILRILNEMDVPLDAIHHIFVTHEHTDHILASWLIMAAWISVPPAVDQLTDTILTLCRLTLQKNLCRLFGDRILLVPVTDGQTERILDYDVTFFDIHSTKARQFGFTMMLKNGKKFTCAGDEPYNPLCRPYAEGSDWLLHEAFCLYSEREKYKPYEKHHSTAKDACELAEELEISNLVLWHTEDDHMETRRESYTAEGRQYYHGNLFVPDDGDILDL